MRALVVLSHLPLREGSAAGRCAVGLVQGLREHGVELDVIAARAPWQDDAALDPALGVEVVEVPDAAGWGGRIARLRRPRTTFASGDLLARTLELARRADVVHLEEVDAGALGPHLDHDRWSVHLHCRSARDLAYAPPWSVAGRARMEYVRAERRLARIAPNLVANTPEVAAEFGRHRHGVTLMPLALDPDAYVPSTPVHAPVAGLIGSATWAPTADATRHLVRHVWPRVRELLPDARLRLAGLDMNAETFPDLPARSPGVEWVGEVPSAEGFLSELALMVYPLGRGSGTKVKVLESLALGVPVVTSSSGAEGLAPSEAVQIARDDRAIAETTARLLADPGARARLQASARAAFVDHHAPQVATAPLVALMREIAAPAS
ncbi:glycosyltransferase family 4 protein [Paraconexibacter sp.]|uniref:glycosyltransferase family 4 protein n=1 Tax=Paraconexibacter sp. TaxID=2949640 RepID=UPI0035679D0B